MFTTTTLLTGAAALALTMAGVPAASSRADLSAVDAAAATTTATATAWPATPKDVPLKGSQAWLDAAPAGSVLKTYVHDEYTHEPWAQYGIVRHAEVTISRLWGCGELAYFSPLSSGGGVLQCIKYTTDLDINRYVSSAGDVKYVAKGQVAAAPDGDGFAILSTDRRTVKVYNAWGTLKRSFSVPRPASLEWVGDRLLAVTSLSDDAMPTGVWYNPATGARTTKSYRQYVGGRIFNQTVSDDRTCVTVGEVTVACDRHAQGMLLKLVPNADRSRVAVLRGDTVTAVVTPSTHSVYVLPHNAVFSGWETNSALIMWTLDDEYEETVYRVNTATRTVQTVPMGTRSFYGGAY